MKIFVTGVAGQLGHDVVNELAKRKENSNPNISIIASDVAEEYKGIKDGTAVVTTPYVSLDITDKEKVNHCLHELSPDVVIHCAAWTAVDLAEEEDKKELVYKVNVNGTENIAKAVHSLDQKKENGCKMVYISTDYVFPGDGDTPWMADCKDYAPLNVYGKTKLQGELAVSALLKKFFIVRIAWVFGKNGNNFIKTMLKVGKTHDHLTVVSDQIGTPTYTYDLAIFLCDLIETERYGYYHATNSELEAQNAEEEKSGYSQNGCKLGYISWYDFTKEIFRIAVELGHTEYSPDHILVTPVTTEEYGISKAKRPFNSRLDKSKLEENGFNKLPAWPDAVKRYMKECEF